ncbi:MAG: hypothetical protein ABIQ60_04395 [Burkholderiaceae bacterium]
MATAPRSTIPIATPKLPDRLVEGLRRAVAEPAQHAGAYVKLSASGGVHGESYEFEYRVDAAGRVSGRLLDELKGVRVSGADAGARKGAKPASAADPKRFAQAVKAIDIEALMRSDAPSGGFVPDSVVGRLEVSDGEQTATFLFQIDDAPAGRATATAAAPLRRATDAVWSAAAAHFGFDVKP